MRKLLVATVLLAGLLGSPALTACATPAAGPPTAPPTTAPVVPLRVTVTGGIAATDRALDVAADGKWIYTDRISGKSNHGQLTPAQLDNLVGLLSDPDLPRQLLARPTNIVCADTHEYTLQFGASPVYRIDECGGLQPAVRAVLAALADATPI